ncbi:MAG: T9SS type A sorting domain-containing protein [Candidatus Marinimicrobia bacterium]|nr:T9SS type A sorting domain-containing protein [Candidatus Neomarinimicrobiota bacterium]
MKKIIFLLLISIIAVYAQTATPPSVGDGSESNPYQIAILENLYWIAADTSNWDKYYIQTTNINASNVIDWFNGKGWLPIAYEPGEYFSGSYNAQGYGISNLYINRPDKSEIGLFGSLYGANILNLFLTDLIIMGQDCIGGIAGSAYDSYITNCHTDGIIQAVYEQNSYYGGANVGGLIGIGSGIIDSCTSMANVTGDHPVGGIIGLLSFNSLVKNCVFRGTVNASVSGGIAGGNSSKISQCVNKGKIYGSWMAGGISGSCLSAMDEINPRLLIDKCYNEGEISGNISGTTRIGGVAGHAYNAIISDCYNVGKVSGSTATGGLIGYIQTHVEIRNSYNAGDVSNGNGGLIGYQFSPWSIEIMNCFWDIDSSGLSISDGGIGVTTHEMKTDTTFISNGWDFDETWTINDTNNNGYPYLLWNEEIIGQITPLIPESNILKQNYPNPFNPSTTISYEIREDSYAKLDVYSITGQLVETLADGYHQAGAYSINWNAGNYSSGIYIYRLEYGEKHISRKMVLLK